jgi:hypothetical protein
VDGGAFDGSSALATGGGEVRRGFKFIGDVGVAGAARGGDGDAFDQVGHCHFDVEFDEVGEGVELDVAVTMLVVGVQ